MQYHIAEHVLNHLILFILLFLPPSDCLFIEMEMEMATNKRNEQGNNNSQENQDEKFNIGTNRLGLKRAIHVLDYSRNTLVWSMLAIYLSSYFLSLYETSLLLENISRINLATERTSAIYYVGMNTRTLLNQNEAVGGTNYTYIPYANVNDTYTQISTNVNNLAARHKSLYFGGILQISLYFNNNIII